MPIKMLTLEDLDLDGKRVFARVDINTPIHPETHELMEQARYTLDPKKRRELYTEATQIIHDEKPWLELFQEIGYPVFDFQLDLKGWEELYSNPNSSVAWQLEPSVSRAFGALSPAVCSALV